MSDYTLSVDVKANDQASATFDKIKGNVNSFKSELESAGGKMQSVGKSMSSAGKTMTAAVTAPLAGIGVASAKAAIDFESGMAKVSTIADTTQVPMKDLEKQILHLSSETGVAATDIAESVYSAISAGQSTGDAVNFVSNATKLAKAGFTDAGTSLDVLTTIMNAYGKSAGSVESISDKLITTQNLGKTTVAELGSSMGKVIPTANMYGVNLDNIASAYVATTKNGISTAESTTYINGMLNELGKSSSGVAKIIQGETGKSFKELMDSGASLTDVLGIVQGHCDKTGQSIGDVFSSQEAAKAAATLTQHAEDFDGAMKEMGASAEATQKAYDKMDATKAAQMQKTLNRLKNDGIALGQAMITTLGPAVSELAKVATAAADAFSKLPPEAQGIIVKAGLIAAAVGPILSIGGKITTGAGKIVSGIGAIAGKMGGLASSAGTAVSPVASSATAVGGLANSALGLIAAGAGILLASAGLSLLAYSAVQIAQEGPGAAGALVLLVASLAAVAAGAAALAPALTAGAVGLVAFGAGLALVGVGILAASAGMTLLATQLPTISEYGMSAAGAIAVLGISMISYAGGATLAGGASAILAAGLVVLAAGMVAAGAGAVVAAAGVTLFGAGVMVLSAGVIVLGAGVLALGSGLTLCGAGLVLIAGNAATAAVGFTALTVATTAAFVPIVAGAASTLTLDVALIGLTATLALSTAGAVALDVAMLALAAEMVTIAGSANTAATDLKTMVTAVKVVETGLSSLKTIAQQAVKDFVSAFSSGIPNAKTTAQSMATGVTNAVKMGLNPIPANTNTTLSQMNRNATTNFSRMNQSVSSQMSKALSTVQRNIRQMEAAFRSARFNFSQHIAVPHFSMSGSFNPQTGSTPSVSVSWYRKAYDQAYMFNTPTVFGASGMGFGDGNGTEIVTGDEHLIDLMRDALSDMGGNIVIPVYVGQERIDELVVTAQQRTNFRSGGR